VSATAARELLERARDRLQAACVGEARREARLLLAAAIGIDQTALLADPDRLVEQQAAARFAAYVGRREQREPVSRILGTREFWSLTFRVTPATLDPRPDSETLIEAALAAVAGRAAALRILDLGTGTGCLLLALLAELPHATGLGIDLDAAAVAAAQANARDLGLADRAVFRVGDWLAGEAEFFDVVVANPPYIPAADIDLLEPEVARWEPRRALAGGADGLDAYRILAPQIAARLQPEGVAVLEFGAGQDQAVARILMSSGLEIRGFRHDLGGVLRCVLAARGSAKK
jgi:release factor glutamine methyltransferase